MEGNHNSGSKVMKRRRFTTQELEEIKAIYPYISNKEIARMYDRSIHSIEALALRFKYRKSKEYLRKLSESSFLIKNGAKYRFKKGHIPANRGKNLSKENYDKLKPTMFKPGHQPINTKYDGCESLRPDRRTGREYLYIRVSVGTWVPKHKYLWEKSKGKIPAGYVLRFKDGNTKNVVLDNLELVSKKDNMRKNSVVNYPKEMQDLIRLKGTFHRCINKINKLNIESKEHGSH